MKLPKGMTKEELKEKIIDTYVSAPTIRTNDELCRLLGVEFELLTRSGKITDLDIIRGDFEIVMKEE